MSSTLKKKKDIDIKGQLLFYDFLFKFIGNLLSVAIISVVGEFIYFGIIGQLVYYFSGLTLKYSTFTAFDISILVIIILIFVINIGFYFTESIWRIYYLYHRKRRYLTEFQKDFINNYFIDGEID